MHSVLTGLGLLCICVCVYIYIYMYIFRGEILKMLHSHWRTAHGNIHTDMHTYLCI